MKDNYEAIKNSSLSCQLANEHWEFIERWLEMVYKDAFTHGFKHGFKHGMGKVSQLNIPEGNYYNCNGQCGERYFGYAFKVPDKPGVYCLDCKNRK